MIDNHNCGQCGHDFYTDGDSPEVLFCPFCGEDLS